MIVVIDESKRVGQLGGYRLPIEVLPFASGFVTRTIKEMTVPVTLRMAGAVPYRTDQQNFILDCRFGPIAEPFRLASLLSAIPGVLGHGLFLTEIDAAYIGIADGVDRIERKDRGI
jgi:ribose 5-phosphate isomerase A